MESLTKEFEVEIGKIRYTFTIEFNYYEGINSIDPTECTDHELNWWDFDGNIFAWDMEEETESIVTDPKEIEMIKNWICVEDLFEDAIS